MGRAPRITEGGFVYYIVCRGLAQRTIFHSQECLTEFIDIVRESLERFEPRLLAYALVPNQWHMLVIPRKDGDLSKWVAWVTSVHAMRNKHLTADLPTNGIYERRFRSFPVQENHRLTESLVWIESLPFRSDITKTELEEGSSGTIHCSSLKYHAGQEECSWLSSPPVGLQTDWNAHVAKGLTYDSQKRIEYSIDRGAPYGDAEWVDRIAKRFRLESTLRPRGRPPKT